MKNIFFTLLFLGFSFTISAQSQPKVGDELIVNEAATYTYVKFPKANILKKRGKVTGYKSVYGKHVIIDDVITNANGSISVILKKKDGSKFFGLKTKVKANYEKAIKAGELSKTGV